MVNTFAEVEDVRSVVDLGRSGHRGTEQVSCGTDVKAEKLSGPL